VFVAIPKGHYSGLWIEFKAGKNKLTIEQKEFKSRMEEVGYICSIAYSVEEALKSLENYFLVE
jgi:hypothetical protein